MLTALKVGTLLTLLGAVAAVVVVASVTGTEKQDGRPGIAGDKGAGRRGGPGDAPQPVLVAAAKTEDVSVVLEGVGTAKALNTVVVRAQVEGRILRYHFKEGDTVKKGDLLAEIDPAPYKAALDQVVARRQLTETQLANARRDLERLSKVSAGVVAQKTIDTQEAQVAQLEAQVKADAAAIASAETTFAYTRVLAPISGRTGFRQMDEGNIARGADQNGLVTITQIQPIAVVFTLPQQQLQLVNAALSAGPVSADAMDGDNRIALDRGVVQVIDNQVDQTTGTIKLKAEFPNEARKLWPGQFVNVRLVADTLKQVVTVPTPAVQRGPLGTFVFVLQGGDTVAQRPVTIGLQTDTVSVVRRGLQSGETVVASGFTRLQDGAWVRIADPAAAPASTIDPAVQPGEGAAPAGPGTRRDRGEGKGRRRERPVEQPAAETAPGQSPTQTARPGTGAPSSTPQ
jgi:multidrug efflux system membrane fusion protein